MTITQDRILPQLLPGILVQSERARYLSYYAFLLSEYKRRKLPATQAALSDYIKQREFELGVALEFCPRGCGTPGLVGRLRTRPAHRALGDELARGESVQSFLGGYGLYYRTPLLQLGIAARAGTPFGDELTPVDVLMTNDRAQALGDHYRTAIADTAYYRDHMRGTQPIPRAALEELAERACLCQLDHYDAERRAIREAVFEEPTDQLAAEFAQRRRSFALFLTLLERDPGVTSSDWAFRQAAIDALITWGDEDGARAEIAAQWAALAMKECMQEALSSIWHDLCASALEAQPPEGYSSSGLAELVRERLAASRALDLPSGRLGTTPTESTRTFQQRLIDATAPTRWSELAEWAALDDSAVGGLACLLVIARRLPQPAGDASAWVRIAGQVSAHQTGLLPLARALDAHLAGDPTVAETLEWVVRLALILPHETIAYSKLPDFTFRFRWEGGRLRFYDNGVRRFDLADPRRNSISRISQDLGLWRDPEAPELTVEGRSFVEAVLG